MRQVVRGGHPDPLEVWDQSLDLAQLGEYLEADAVSAGFGGSHGSVFPR